ncbi:MAG: hypothetical protein FJ135_00400 [Deltaproteobacteria bacterium]|nr:hypothetical protein [Deltaproteobacteria bacterium]
MMDAKQMGQDMIRLSKTAFDVSYNTMMLFQDQMVRFGTMCYGQMVGFPEEMKKDLAEWTNCYKKNCQDIKKAMDDGFTQMESFIA